MFLIIAIPASAQSELALSQGALAVSNAVDTASSWGGYELNPVLGRGEFGKRQVATKAALTAGLVVAEDLAVRKHPRLRKPFAVMNWVVSGLLGGVAISNWRRR